MTHERDFDRIARAYMADGPTQLADRVLDDALAEVHLTRQRRVLRHVPWRYLPMNAFAKLAVAAVAVIVVGAVGLAILRPGTSQVGGQSVAPSASSATPSAGPSTSVPSPRPELGQTFTSPINGLSIAHPAGWTVRAATEPWVTGGAEDDKPWVDTVTDGPTTGASTFLVIASQQFPAGGGDQWSADYLAGNTRNPCGAMVTEPVRVDGVAGVIDLHCPMFYYEAILTGPDRGYAIALYGPTPDLEWFKQILATVKLHPENAVVAGPSPSS
jgi:hypothetical protein